MKKVFLCTCFLISSFCMEAKQIDAKSSDFEELVRGHSGEIEEIRHLVGEVVHRVETIEQNLGMFPYERVTKKDPAQIAKEIKGKSPEEVIEAAKDLIELKQYQEARDLLEIFVKENPKNLYCGRMHFYIGKSYFEEEKYQQAAKAYMESFEINPNGEKTPKALFRLSQCFLKLRKQDQRKMTLEKLASTFPNFRYGKKAIAKLNELKSL